MGYLFQPNSHICSCPNESMGPDDRRVIQSTRDQIGTVWQCDECQSIWEVREVVGSWRAYYKTRRKK